jgi:hypothetical protein
MSILEGWMQISAGCLGMAIRLSEQIRLAQRKYKNTNNFILKEINIAVLLKFCKFYLFLVS